MAQHDDGRPQWSEDIALDLMGSMILVGITHLSHDGEFVRQEQMFGRVVAANEREGVCLKLEGARDGDYYWMPPDLRFYERAKPGLYTLRSTGEELHDPDYITTWTLTAPPPDWKPDEEDGDTRSIQ